MIDTRAAHRRALAGCLIVAGITIARAATADDAQAPIIGDAAPPITAETLDGAALPDGVTTGRITVVDFFATWCGPCHHALADLAAIRGELGPRVQILLIDVEEDPGRVRRFFTSSSPDAPLPDGAQVLVDRTGAVARRWGQNRFPTTFLVDEKGVIRHINRGWGSGYRERLGRWLRAMLAGERHPRPPAAAP